MLSIKAIVRNMFTSFTGGDMDFSSFGLNIIGINVIIDDIICIALYVTI